MGAFQEIERGTLPTGEAFRVVRRWDGWVRAFVTVNGVEKRRSMRWLKEHRREDERWLDGEAPLLLLAREIERGEHRRKEEK